MSYSYYVYALKDPRTNPAQIFYIGKGTGSRSSDHITQIDNTQKGMFIQEILNEGHQVIISTLVNNLTESQALKIESELIASFGTVNTGGCLYNTVIPKGLDRKIQKNINVPNGILEKAQIGLNLLKDSIEELSKTNPTGITNSDAAHYLGLQSDNEGKQKDYLTYSILGILLKENRVISIKKGNKRKYQHISHHN
ncbi:GIY-YIG nuclease family protein [Kangiella sp. TOML190]|uniref:GIY-YIG nuclease family protein n=1 Tax=Kangiella sp. TOML190 TaxID=2931351 RepID=UPI00203F83B8|nr:GIY-YIG nuclease family protein [Kangiella sp. TOML190]